MNLATSHHGRKSQHGPACSQNQINGSKPDPSAQTRSKNNFKLSPTTTMMMLITSNQNLHKTTHSLSQISLNTATTKTLEGQRIFTHPQLCIRSELVTLLMCARPFCPNTPSMMCRQSKRLSLSQLRINLRYNHPKQIS